MFKNIIFLTLFLSIFDTIYLYNNRELYQDFIIDIKKDNIIYCFLIWFVISLAIYFLVIENEPCIFNIIKKSFILALSIYITFNLTNYLILKNKWTKKIAFYDTLWGVFLIMFASINCKFLLNNI
jgi:hypothetical protein